MAENAPLKCEYVCSYLYAVAKFLPLTVSAPEYIYGDTNSSLVFAGVGGLLGAVAYGIYGYRNRGNMSTSVYIMHFRVIAQGMVVGAITIGVGMNITIKLWERYVKALPPLPAANEKK